MKNGGVSASVGKRKGRIHLVRTDVCGWRSAGAEGREGAVLPGDGAAQLVVICEVSPLFAPLLPERGLADLPVQTALMAAGTVMGAGGLTGDHGQDSSLDRWVPPVISHSMPPPERLPPQRGKVWVKRNPCLSGKGRGKRCGRGDHIRRTV